MGVIEDLAVRATHYITGIPWSSITSDPYADVYGQLQYYVQLREKMREVFEFADQIDWTWDVVNDPEHEDAIVAWYGVEHDILAKENLLKSALVSNVSEVSGSAAPEFDLEIYRAFVSEMFALAMRGFIIHENLLLQLDGKDPALIVNNADAIHALLMALRKLWDLGLLNPLRKSSALSGLGVGALAPAVATAIVIGSVVALSIIAWFLVKMTALLSQWQLGQEICSKAMQDPTPEKLKACREAQQAIKDASNIGSPMDVYTTLAWFGGIGILVYVGATVLPDLLVGLQRARSAA